MDLSPELFDEIDAYVRNRMKPEDRDRFRQRIAENGELRQEVALQRKLHAGMDVALNRQQEVDTQAASIRQQFAQVRFERHLQRRQRQRTYVIAASIAILLICSIIVLVNQLNKPMVTEVAFNNYYEPETRKRSDILISADLLVAQNDYYTKHYYQALARLKKIPDDSLYRVTYYRGLTQLALDQTTDARSSFQLSRTSVDSVIHYRSEWYLSLTLLRANEPAQALEILRQISKNPRQLYQKEAVLILRDLQ